MSRAAEPVTGRIHVPEGQPLHATHGPSGPVGAGLRPLDHEPVGRAQPAGSCPIGLELDETACHQVALSDAVTRRLDDHTGRRHGIDRQIDGLGAGLVDRGGDRTVQAQDMAASDRDHNPGPGTAGLDRDRAGFPIQNCTDVPREGDRERPRKRSLAARHQLEPALHKDLLRGHPRDAMEGRARRDGRGRRRLVHAKAGQPIEIRQAEDDPIRRP